MTTSYINRHFTYLLTDLLTCLLLSVYLVLRINSRHFSRHSQYSGHQVVRRYCAIQIYTYTYILTYFSNISVRHTRSEICLIYKSMRRSTASLSFLTGRTEGLQSVIRYSFIRRSFDTSLSPLISCPMDTGTTTRSRHQKLQIRRDTEEKRRKQSEMNQPHRATFCCFIGTKIMTHLYDRITVLVSYNVTESGARACEIGLRRLSHAQLLSIASEYFNFCTPIAIQT